jgi:D-arabinose 1-dehydrogenase-like Zn-dependent alcohol dehydrogenase
VVGNVVPEKVSINLGALITRAITLIGGSGATRRDMAALLRLHQQAPFRIPIAEELPLSDAEAAQRRLLQGNINGRLALIPTLPA